MEELVRLTSTYSTQNMDKLRTLDGSRNIVSFNDLYKSGLIKNDEIIDPATNERLTGCMALTWNTQTNRFDIEYTENCITSVNISGTITGKDASNAKVYLAQGYNDVYHTTTDETGKYNFNNIVPGRYVLVVSQNTRTKYGEEVEVYENTVKNMEITLYKGDFNNNNIINKVDRDFSYDCITDIASDEMPSRCFENGVNELDYDLDGNGTVTLADHTALTSNYAGNKISQIVLNGTASLKGKIINYGKIKPTINFKNNLTNYTTTINDDGTFEFSNIPRGSYVLQVKKSGWLPYSKYIYLDKDINGINVNIYPGDVLGDYAIDTEDIEEMQRALDNLDKLKEKEKVKYDLNEDGIIDNSDMYILKNNLGKVSNID